MNTDKFAPGSFVTDPTSAGFSIPEISDLLLKNYLWKGTTSAQLPYWKEPAVPPRIHANQIFGDEIPSTPPVDFTPLNDTQISTTFGISISEIDVFRTTINASNVFRIEQSASFPYIYKISNLLLRPIAANPDLAFNAISPQSKVNMLATPIQFSLYNGVYKGSICRTDGSGELSNNGNDIIKETQFSYIFDTNIGIFTCYEIDNSTCYSNSVNRTRPPAVTCYVYRGTFGFNSLLSSGVTSLQINSNPAATGPITFTAGNNIILSTLTSNNFLIATDGSSNNWEDVGVSNAIYYDAGPVIIGTNTIIDPYYELAVNGTMYGTTVQSQTYITISDERLKQNIAVYTTPTSILQISTVSFQYKTAPSTTQIGVLAQDVEHYAPELVKTINGYKSIQYDRLAVLLLPILRQQQSTIEALQAALLN
jgi:hypothetical protein